jgi:hypothetical protein
MEDGMMDEEHEAALELSVDDLRSMFDAGEPAELSRSSTVGASATVTGVEMLGGAVVGSGLYGHLHTSERWWQRDTRTENSGVSAEH